MDLYRPLQHFPLYATTTMPALKASLTVARIAEASGAPYIGKLAKVAVVIFELLEVHIPSLLYGVCV